MSNAAKDIAEHRRERLQGWIDTHFAGRQSHFLESIAVRTGEIANQGELSGLLSGKKSFGEKKARKLEVQAAMPNLYLDSADSSPIAVSLSVATIRDAHHTGVRKVRIEGAVVMDENGFWSVGDIEAEETAYPTEDPDAYAIRVTSQRFQPVVALAQCILVSPRSPLKPGRPVVVTMNDGRKTLRTFVSREPGVWNLTSVNNANDYLDLAEGEVARVERVMAYLWTD